MRPSTGSSQHLFNTSPLRTRDEHSLEQQNAKDEANATACAQQGRILGKRLFRTRKMRQRSTSSTVNQAKLVRNHSLFPEDFGPESTRNTTIFSSSIPTLLNVKQNGTTASVDINIKPAIDIPEFEELNDNSYPVNGNDFSAAGVVSKEHLRKQKSHRFRVKRRELKMKLHGSQFNVREGIKNPMR